MMVAQSFVVRCCSLDDGRDDHSLFFVVRSWFVVRRKLCDRRSLSLFIGGSSLGDDCVIVRGSSLNDGCVNILVRSWFVVADFVIRGSFIVRSRIFIDLS